MKPRLASNYTAMAGLDTSSSFKCASENTAKLLFVSSLLGFSHWKISCKETDFGLCLSPWIETQNNNKNAQKLGVVFTLKIQALGK